MKKHNFFTQNPLMDIAFFGFRTYFKNLSDEDLDMKTKLIKAGWTLFDISLVGVAVYVFFF